MTGIPGYGDDAVSVPPAEIGYRHFDTAQAYANEHGVSAFSTQIGE